MRDPVAAAGDDGSFSIGEYLKAQRTIRGIALEDLATRTRIPLRSLSLLESGAFDRNPDGFVRGFVRTVSDALGLDPEDTLMRMLTEPVAAESVGTRLAASVPTPWILAALAVASALVVGFVVLAVSSFDASGATREVVVRRDPVRALAAAHAASAPAAEPGSAQSPGAAHRPVPDPPASGARSFQARPSGTSRSE